MESKGPKRCFTFVVVLRYPEINLDLPDRVTVAAQVKTIVSKLIFLHDD